VDSLQLLWSSGILGENDGVGPRCVRKVQHGGRLLPLTALSETQRTQALERFAVIRPALEDGVTQAQVARTHHLSPSTVRQWIKRYR
jgi:DNA-binding NarL/FixJ family response regulator